MGSLQYGQLNQGFDDRALAHLQIVITAKLRRHESFLFSWQTKEFGQQGRAAIWISPASSLIYRFDGGRMPTINRSWLQALSDSANSAGGLELRSEPNSALTGGT